MFVFPLNDALSAVYNEVYRGYGGFGALGHSVYTRELSPKKVEGNWDGKITQIATSGTHTAAITEAGDQIVSHTRVVAYDFLIHLFD